MQDETPNDTPRQDTSPAQPTDNSPVSAQEQPAQEGQDPASVGQTQAQDTQSADVSQETPTSEEDVAPDADEPGDDETPVELVEQTQESPNQPDEVDQEG